MDDWWLLGSQGISTYEAPWFCVLRKFGFGVGDNYIMTHFWIVALEDHMGYGKALCMDSNKAKVRNKGQIGYPSHSIPLANRKPRSPWLP